MQCTHCITHSMLVIWLGWSGAAPQPAQIVFDPHVPLVQPAQPLDAEVDVPRNSPTNPVIAWPSAIDQHLS